MQACSPDLIVGAEYFYQIQRLAAGTIESSRRISNEEILRRLDMHALKSACTIFTGGLDTNHFFVRRVRSRQVRSYAQNSSVS